jgi:hypothetical protein
MTRTVEEYETLQRVLLGTTKQMEEMITELVQREARLTVLLHHVYVASRQFDRPLPSSLLAEIDEALSTPMKTKWGLTSGERVKQVMDACRGGEDDE